MWPENNLFVRKRNWWLGSMNVVSLTSIYEREREWERDYCMCMITQIPMCVWRSENNLRESILAYHVGKNVGNKYLYQLSCSVSPLFIYLFEFIFRHWVLINWGELKRERIQPRFMDCCTRLKRLWARGCLKIKHTEKTGPCEVAVVSVRWLWGNRALRGSCGDHGVTVRNTDTCLPQVLLTWR